MRETRPLARTPSPDQAPRGAEGAEGWHEGWESVCARSRQLIGQSVKTAYFVNCASLLRTTTAAAAAAAADPLAAADAAAQPATAVTQAAAATTTTNTTNTTTTTTTTTTHPTAAATAHPTAHPTAPAAVRLLLVEAEVLRLVARLAYLGTLVPRGHQVY